MSTWMLPFLGLIAAGCVAGLAFIVRAVHGSPSWHPGDDLPDVPGDAPLRDRMG